MKKFAWDPEGLGSLHEKGNKDCPSCFEPPWKHNDCRGLVHSEFGDEYSDGDFWLYKKCDLCGKYPS